MPLELIQNDAALAAAMQGQGRANMDGETFRKKLQERIEDESESDKEYSSLRLSTLARIIGVVPEDAMAKTSRRFAILRQEARASVRK